MNTKYEEAKQPLLGANPTVSTFNSILSYLPEGPSITSCGSDGVISFNYGSADYSGKCNEKGMPIGKWKRKEGGKTESVEFCASYTKNNTQYTNVFVVPSYFSNPKVILGTFTYSNGEKYEGEWKDDKKHGEGTITCSNGEKYEGEWKDGKRHGKGTFTYSNGEKYEGEWKDGKLHGEGIYTDIDGYSYVIENIENHGSIFTTTSSLERQTYLNDLANQNESGVVRYETYKEAKKAYEAAQNISINQEEELKQSEILNSSQNNSQPQQAQFIGSKEEKGEPSFRKSGLGLGSDTMLNPDDIKLDITEGINGSNTAAQLSVEKQNTKNGGLNV